MVRRRGPAQQMPPREQGPSLGSVKQRNGEESTSQQYKNVWQSRLRRGRKNQTVVGGEVSAT